jgi:hypothetical protein
MEIRKLMRWGASALAAVFLLGPGGNYVYDFYRSSDFSGLPRFLVGILETAANLASESWFHWTGGLSLGLALGLWADWFKQPQVPPPIPRVTRWFDLDEAGMMFAPGDLIREYTKLYSDHRTAEREYDATHQPQSGTAQLNQSLEALFERERALQPLAAKVAMCVAKMDKTLVPQLVKGGLVSKGFVGSKISLDQKEVAIPSAHWRVIRVEPGNKARGAGIDYCAIQVGQRENIIQAAARIALFRVKSVARRLGLGGVTRRVSSNRGR